MPTRKTDSLAALEGLLACDNDRFPPCNNMRNEDNLADLASLCDCSKQDRCLALWCFTQLSPHDDFRLFGDEREKGWNSAARPNQVSPRRG